MTKTSSPIAASAVPRLMAVVVLPTPPFWLATASTRQASADTGEALHFENAPLRVAAAPHHLAAKAPGHARLGHLCLSAAALQEESDPAPGQGRPCEAEQPAQR